MFLFLVGAKNERTFLFFSFFISCFLVSFLFFFFLVFALRGIVTNFKRPSYEGGWAGRSVFFSSLFFSVPKYLCIIVQALRRSWTKGVGMDDAE